MDCREGMSAGVAGRKVYWWVASWAFAEATGSCMLNLGVSALSLSGCLMRVV